MNLRRIYDATAREKDYLAVARQFPKNIYAQLPKDVNPFDSHHQARRKRVTSPTPVLQLKSPC